MSTVATGLYTWHTSWLSPTRVQTGAYPCRAVHTHDRNVSILWSNQTGLTVPMTIRDDADLIAPSAVEMPPVNRDASAQGRLRSSQRSVPPSTRNTAGTFEPTGDPPSKRKDSENLRRIQAGRAALRRLKLRKDSAAVETPPVHRDASAQGHLPSGQRSDSPTAGTFKSTGDPRSKRKVGTQSEVPTITAADDNTRLIVRGYQAFDLHARNLDQPVVQHYVRKFAYIKQLLTRLWIEEGCRSMIDIGCSAGLISLIGKGVGFERIHSLDHDAEYVDVVRRIASWAKFDESILPREFSFGAALPATADVVFCGALIHWVFCRTADFQNSFDRIFDYLYFQLCAQATLWSSSGSRTARFPTQNGGRKGVSQMRAGSPVATRTLALVSRPPHHAAQTLWNKLRQRWRHEYSTCFASTRSGQRYDRQSSTLIQESAMAAAAAAM